MPNKIDDYGIIGDTQTSALVSRGGSINWFCAPRFDSDACFAALLGTDEHGYFSLRPAAKIRSTRQRYRDDTLILETEFDCAQGAVRVIDFMPVSQERSDIVRILEGLEGELPMELILAPRFGFGKTLPWIELDARGVSLTAGPDALRLSTTLPLSRRGSYVEAIVPVRKGDRLAMTLTWFPSHRAPPERLNAEQALADTESHWREWAGRCTYTGRWRDAVIRSLITLKALTYAPTGGIVAAPTTSLPEEIGGVRNWDYRFCWLRDATLTLHALMIGGYGEEAEAFRHWVARASAGDATQLQIMYGLNGERRLSEVELDWLPGFEGSRPVRLGNDASRQFQLDVYGEVFSAIYRATELGLGKDQPGQAERMLRLMDFLEAVWQRPDDGIWEVRGGRRHFTHSKLMAWVAVDRAIRAQEKWKFSGPKGDERLPHWRATRGRIREDILAGGFNERLGAFTQYYGSDTLDASVLVMAHVGFLPPNDPRMKGTVRAIERQLLRNGFVLRYSTEAGVDGLPGSEAPFLACSFWLADNYALAGRLDEAEALFEKLLATRNHLGLLAEEYDPISRRQLGNFPQAFSHLAQIFSAALISSPDLRARAGHGLDEAAMIVPEAVPPAVM